MDKIKSTITKYLDPEYGFYIATELKKFVNSVLVALC